MYLFILTIFSNPKKSKELIKQTFKNTQILYIQLKGKTKFADKMKKSSSPVP
jgi:SNF2 family DNA or RNA helicase